LAAALSTGSFAVPSHTTNQRWFCAPCAPWRAFDALGLMTPVQIWPFGLEVSENFTS
jgi:hypothetical protein